VLDSPLCRVRPVTSRVPGHNCGSKAGDVFGNLVRMNDGERHASAKPAIAGTISAFDPDSRDRFGAARSRPDA
jgi:hypothetical protein